MLELDNLRKIWDQSSPSIIDVEIAHIKSHDRYLADQLSIGWNGSTESAGNTLGGDRYLKGALLTYHLLRESLQGNFQATSQQTAFHYNLHLHHVLEEEMGNSAEYMRRLTDHIRETESHLYELMVELNPDRPQVSDYFIQGIVDVLIPQQIEQGTFTPFSTGN